jgi:hypothetical protein
MILFLWLAACTSSAPDDNKPDDTEPDVVIPDEPVVEALDPVRHLVRASLDLRGVRPTVAEIEAIEADPTQLEPMITGFVEGDRFNQRISALFAEVFHTRDEDPFVLLDYYFPEHSLENLSRSIGEEPLRVLAEIATADLSLDELVTGDWTMANDVLADIWPIDRPEVGGAWRRSHYTDDRPAAGVLAANGMWWQFGSMENNLNRGRANQVSRVFLCQDYLELQIDFGTDQPLDSEAALGDAIRTDPKCASCHDSLDPLASHMFGFWYYGTRKKIPPDMTNYHPSREREWVSYDMPPPAFRGVPTTGLYDLGQMIVRDPRFPACFVRHSFRTLLRRAPDREEQPLLDALTAGFEERGRRLKGLFVELALSEPYTVGSGERSLKLVDPALLAQMTYDLTGYRMTVDSWDLIRAPMSGYLPLAGGVDGIHRWTPMTEPETTFLLVDKRLAEAAASHVVQHDLVGDEPPLLLTLVDGTEDPVADRDLIAAQLVELHLRILSQRVTADDPAIAEEIGLYQAVLDLGRTRQDAWTAVISLLLRDPDYVTY